MKKLFLALPLLIALSGTPALADHIDGFHHDVTVSVNGMVCDFCAQSVKKVFGKEDSVEAVDVNLDTGEIIVDLKDGQNLDDAIITKLVTDAGYSITNITHAGK